MPGLFISYIFAQPGKDNVGPDGFQSRVPGLFDSYDGACFDGQRGGGKFQSRVSGFFDSYPFKRRRSTVQG